MSGVSPVLVEWFHGLAWGCWCGRDHGLGCPVGMSGSGMGMLLGSRTASGDLAIRKPAGGTMVLLLCRLRGRMVDALADSTDEGRLRMR